jgi:hypothetical protein
MAEITMARAMLREAEQEAQQNARLAAEYRNLAAYLLANHVKGGKLNVTQKVLQATAQEVALEVTPLKTSVRLSLVQREQEDSDE